LPGNYIYFTFFAVRKKIIRTFLNKNTMSRVCEITGKKAIVGNKVSHSNTKTKRKFNVNLKVKKFFLPLQNLQKDDWIYKKEIK